ncbi:MAG: NAD-dependent succinate-semialdehyde dehydrogenase [Chthoniobacterales bacterium]
MPESLQLKNGELFCRSLPVCGEWRATGEAGVDLIRNPASRELLAKLPALSEQEVEESLQFSYDAMQPWRHISAAERAQSLLKWHALLLENQDDLAAILTAECGKPLTEARAEIAYGAAYVQWFAEEARRIYGDVIPGNGGKNRIFVFKEPVGLCCAITPWNFPNAMIARKVAPALAAGCAIVVKPAPQTPLSALAMAFLAEQAGIPKGLFSVVAGDAVAIGKVFCKSPLVRKLTFTGSTATGKILLSQCVHDLKRVSLELGGNAPFIVFEDADLDAAVAGCITSKFRNAGQTCVCVNRIYVHDRLHDSFVKKLSNAVKKLRVGNPMDTGVEIGPLIDKAAVEKVETLLSDALNSGAQVSCGGRRHALGGQFFEPTVLTDCQAGMRLADEEIFGPVAAVFRFKSEEEVIALANATRVGLAGYFYTQNTDRVWRVAEALECGMVGINTGTVSNPAAPFGGIKESGMGREGSKYGINDYVNIKYVNLA